MKGRGLMAAEPTRGGDRKAVGRGYVGRRGPGWAEEISGEQKQRTINSHEFLQTKKKKK